MARKNNRIKTYDNKKFTFNLSKPPLRGDVWFAELGRHPGGSVQGGCRPVIILSNNMGNAFADTVNVVPMTRHLKKPNLPCHTEISPELVADRHQALDVSMILAEQITTISKYALRNYVGHIYDTQMLSAIEQSVIEQLGITKEVR